MQFKHPEFLYALALLIIPIIVHLFQLRRFQKVNFTNVSFLKAVKLQTRKSSQLKKWLLLFTRLFLLASIIMAFAQPFISNIKNLNTSTELVVYLDNSFSMQAKGQNGTLLNTAIQDLINNIDAEETITFFTNDVFYPKTTLKAFKNELIQIEHSSSQLSYDAVTLKGKMAFSKEDSSIKHLVMISDFQKQDHHFNTSIDSTFHLNLVQLKPETTANISIDSVFISKQTIENLELRVELSSQEQTTEPVSVSLYNKEKLYAKTAVNLKDKAYATFTIPSSTSFEGRISIDDDGLQYDNQLFFNINSPQPIRVLSINNADDNFLRKLYTKDEFLYSTSNLNNLDYNIIPDQNLIILNELKQIPNALVTVLNSFMTNGGFVVVIPSEQSELSSYNSLLLNLDFKTKVEQERKVTQINFSHPLFENVFDKEVQNFQYPSTQKHFKLSTNVGQAILSFEDNTPFLTRSNALYLFTAPIDEGNSNFKNSPLIVPVLYNIGKQSLQLPKLYYTIGNEEQIDISVHLQQDDVLTLEGNGESIIPLQRNYLNKVSLFTNEYPQRAGIFSVKNQLDTLEKLSYNYNRSESNLNYMDLSNIDNISNNKTLALTMENIKSATNINALWKWFVIFALAFLLIEMLIIKFLK